MCLSIIGGLSNHLRGGIMSKKKKRKKKRVGVRFFKALIICFLLLIVIGAAGIGIYVKKVIDNTPEVTAKDIMPQGYTTNIVDSNGTLLEQLKDSDSNRVYKKYDEISPYMGKAFVAIEDERFYKHNGIDIQGIIRAGVNGVAHGFHFTEGASTLTQQLITMYSLISSMRVSISELNVKSRNSTLH